ncbi:MAG: hypothetical protein AAB069_04920 [Planctomycetota bacterium]
MVDKETKRVELRLKTWWLPGEMAVYRRGRGGRGEIKGDLTPDDQLIDKKVETPWQGVSASH